MRIKTTGYIKRFFENPQKYSKEKLLDIINERWITKECSYVQRKWLDDWFRTGKSIIYSKYR